MSVSKESVNADEVKRLFAELDAAFKRIAEMTSSECADGNSNAGKLTEEGHKAFAIIKRIREIDGL